MVSDIFGYILFSQITFFCFISASGPIFVDNRGYSHENAGIYELYLWLAWTSLIMSSYFLGINNRNDIDHIIIFYA